MKVQNMNHRLFLNVAYKNRDLDRVKRFLFSLEKQENKNFHLFFTNYGSDENYTKQLETVITQFSWVTYIHNRTEGRFWNRSHALNTGIKKVEDGWVVNTDIDLIFASNFTDTLIKNLSLDKEIHLSAYALPEKFNHWETLFINPPKLKERNLTALGLIQVVPRDTLHEVRGFDEFYRIWGVEDEDLNNRLSKLGLSTEWLKLSETPVYHQWHPLSGRRNRARIPERWQNFMNNYKEDNKDVLQRNNNDWGEVFCIQDRPAISRYENIEKIKVVKLENYPIQIVWNILDEQIDKMNMGDSLLFSFCDEIMNNNSGSKLLKCIGYFNGLSNRFNWPLMLSNDLSYFGKHQDVYSYRDVIAYYLQAKEYLFQDYFLEYVDNDLKLLIVK